MLSVFGPLALAACLVGTEPAVVYHEPYHQAQQPRHHHLPSFLHVVHTGPDGHPHGVADPYLPNEGDIVFFEDHSVFWDTLFRAVASGPPTHCGIVVRRPDGSPALLEAGPDWKPAVYLQDALPRLHQFKGTVWIRRCRHPLTPEQSVLLTRYALLQEGKPYAVPRFLMQSGGGTRFGLRYKLFANTYTDRRCWLCSELVVAAGTVIGLFDPDVHKATAIYPRDIIDDQQYRLRHNWEPAGMWRSDPQPLHPAQIRSW